jgi:hypothetical protein
MPDPAQPPPLGHARRRFDHLATELSVAVGVRVPRHALWLAAAGHLGSGASVAAFCAAPLDVFLADAQLPRPADRERARLRRSVERFDPQRRSPDEVVSGLFAPPTKH